MDSIKSLFGDTKKIVVKKITNRDTERGEMMKYFMDRINPGRIVSGYPKIGYPRMGRLLQKIPTKDLYYLKRVCDDSKNFSSRFFWEINPKKHENVNKYN